MKMFRRLAKEEKGFTLAELVIVLAILGVLAGIAVPVFTKSLTTSQTRADEANVNVVNSAIALYQADHSGELPTIPISNPPNAVSDFNELVKNLYGSNGDYLKQKEIKPQDTTKAFNYNSTAGVVTYE